MAEILLRLALSTNQSINPSDFCRKRNKKNNCMVLGQALSDKTILSKKFFVIVCMYVHSKDSTCVFFTQYYIIDVS